ncbi:DJ-1/PfpI family protein [Neptuniibacter sp. SY11_33]|uniref:DJ-1/PfpI family protein n=1 Tax=Neptuniibacter sp. SY11_33 TaxID=3398215 RepID=UPI0039F5474A
MRKQFVRLTATFVLVLLSQLSFAESKKIGILVFDGVLTSDVTAPLEVFGVASRKTWFSDYTPIVINVVNKASVTTEEGLSLNSPYWIGNAPELDVLIVPSSYDMDPLIKNISLIQFIKNTAKNAEWMASNCSGSFLLGKAGLLNGLKATTWAGGEKELARTFPNVKVQYDQNVVIDGNVITSNGSLVSYQAALALLAKITSTAKADEVAEALQYQRFSKTKYVF